MHTHESDKLTYIPLQIARAHSGTTLIVHSPTDTCPLADAGLACCVCVCVCGVVSFFKKMPQQFIGIVTFVGRSSIEVRIEVGARVRVNHRLFQIPSFCPN